MKLAFCLFNYFPHGGLQKMFLHVAKASVSRGHDVDVYTQSWQGEKPAKLNIQIIPQHGFTNHRRCLNFSNRLQKHLAHNNYDQVIGFNRLPGLDIYFAADNCYAYEHKSQSSHWQRFSKRAQIYHKLEQAVFADDSKTKILFISNKQQQGYAACYNLVKQRYQLLPPYVNEDFINTSSTNTQTEHHQQTILMVGSSFHTKGVDRAILAFANLPEALRQQCTLKIAGTGNPAKFKRLAKRYHVNTQVEFLGVRDDIATLMRQADLLLHPARKEAGGNVLLEAMACGLPVLTTANCGYAEYILAANAGIIIPEPYSQTLCNQQLRIMLTNEQRSIWSENGKRFVQQHKMHTLPQQIVKIIEANWNAR